MDTEEQRQCRRDDTRPNKSGNARSEQLLVIPTESLTKRECLPGELLSGLECQRPGFLLMSLSFFSSRGMPQLKFAIYRRAASLSSQVSSVDECSIG